MQSMVVSNSFSIKGIIFSVSFIPRTKAAVERQSAIMLLLHITVEDETPLSAGAPVFVSSMWWYLLPSA